MQPAIPPSGGGCPASSGKLCHLQPKTEFLAAVVANDGDILTLALSHRVSKIRQWKFIVQELCDSRGGRPGLSVLTSLLVSVDVKNY